MAKWKASSTSHGLIAERRLREIEERQKEVRRQNNLGGINDLESDGESADDDKKDGGGDGASMSSEYSVDGDDNVQGDDDAGIGDGKGHMVGTRVFSFLLQRSSINTLCF